MHGLKLAYVGDDTTYLLYAGRWFPVVNYGINRFTSTINVTVPAHFVAIGSGAESTGATPALPKTKGAATAGPTKTFTFTSDKPSRALIYGTHGAAPAGWPTNRNSISLRQSMNTACGLP